MSKRTVAGIVLAAIIGALAGLAGLGVELARQAFTFPEDEPPEYVEPGTSPFRIPSGAR